MDTIPPVISAPAKYTGGLVFMFSLLFLLVGLVVGYSLALYFPFFETISRQSCTPRPACLDETPRCLIPETPDMCPPETSPSPSSLPTDYPYITDYFKITIPREWEAKTLKTNPDSAEFQSTDGSSLRVFVVDAQTNSLDSFLENLDKADQTSWEGKPSRKILMTKKIKVIGLPAIQREEEWLAAGFTTINTYLLVNDKVYSFYIIPLELPYDQTDVYSNYQNVLDSFEPLSPASATPL